MSRSVHDVALAGLWGRGQRAALDRRPFLSGVAAARTADFVLAGNRGFFAGFVGLGHRTTTFQVRD